MFSVTVRAKFDRVAGHAVTVAQSSVPVATPALEHPVKMGLPQEVDDVSVQLGAGAGAGVGDAQR